MHLGFISTIISWCVSLFFKLCLWVACSFLAFCLFFGIGTAVNGLIEGLGIDLSVGATAVLTIVIFVMFVIGTVILSFMAMSRFLKI